MARKKRKNSSRTRQAASTSGTTPDTTSQRTETADDAGAETETPNAEVSESTAAASDGEPRRFRSYFELLEEKYADEEPPQVVAPEPERTIDPDSVVDRRHTPRPTRKPKPVGRERPARKGAEKAPAKPARSPSGEAGGSDEVRSVTGMIRVDPEPPTPRIRQTQAIALDRNMRWVVVLAFLTGVVLTALVVFFLAGGDDDDFDVAAESVVERPADEPRAPAEEAEPTPAAPFGSVTEIASESPLPEPAAPVAAAPPPPVNLAESSPDSGSPLSESATERVASDAVASDATDSASSSALDETSSAGSGSTSEPADSPPPPPPPSATPSDDEADEEPARAEDAPADASPEDAPRVVVPAYTPARKAFTPQPSYPAEAREQGEEGTVVLSGRVTAAGDVVDARVVESAGPRLDRVALETFRTWQFQPAERDGVAVESPYRVSFRFALDRRPPPPTTGRQPVAPPPPPPAAPPPTAPPATESAAGTVEDPLPFGGDFEPPQRRVSPLPSLPRGRAGEVGNLVLSVVVDREGRVARIETEQGVDPQVTEQAIDAVKRWRFQPATRDGEPVAVWHRLVLRL